ncbi:MAG TPA: TraR/DksA family transcriptional regulator [Lentisphaeria bacterium]|nr:TraR/DksA family transcriptional regulator [Lentisphaeria bacterium]
MEKKKAKSSSQPSALSSQQLDELREMLTKERMLILQRISHASSSLTSNRQAGEESADVGSDDFIRETTLSTLADERKKLQMIEHALKTMNEPSFGICNDCGKPIGLGRLRARPYAKLCVVCKSIREEHGGHRPDDINAC